MTGQRDLRTKVLVRGEESGGHVAIVENAVPGHWEGPPLHRHDFDEAFYVLDGELTFQVDDELTAVRPGELAFVAGGVPHTLAELSGEGARYVLVCAPAGFERYFDRIAAEQAGTDPPPEAMGPIPETVMVGPRIAQSATGTRARRSGERRSVNVLLTDAQSGGRVAVMDNSVSAGATGPPLHHHDFDEAFYVIEGELTFQLGDEVLTRRQGELAFAPRGAHHAFANPSAASARMLLVCTPAGFDRYFQRLAAKEAGVEPPPEALEPWPEVVKVGPPIGERAYSQGPDR
jgi:quercetin dioxygenase-like cupin family protein